MRVLIMCIVDLLLAFHLLYALANTPKHAQIRLLRQQQPITDFASATNFPYTHTNNATLYATERV